MQEGRFCFYLSGQENIQIGKELFELVRFYMLGAAFTWPCLARL